MRAKYEALDFSNPQQITTAIGKFKEAHLDIILVKPPEDLDAGN